MFNFAVLKSRYNQILIVGLMCASLYIMSHGMKAGVSKFDENLPGRRTLISLYTRFRMGLGDRVFSQVLVGKDGWLDFTGHQNLDGYQNSANMSDSDIRAIQNNLLILHNLLSNRNIVLVVVIAPNKATIYPDKLPDEIHQVGDQSELDILAKYMNQYGPPSLLLDLRPVLARERLERDVYFKTDTHWNAYGSFLAYKEIMTQISRYYPELTPKDIDEFKLEITGPPVRDLPRIIGADDMIEIRHDFVPKIDNLDWIVYNDDFIPARKSISLDDDLPTLLMYLDSFGVPLMRLVAPHFGEATFIQNKSAHSDLLTGGVINTTNPDVVVLEFAERNLKQLFDFLENYDFDSIK